jgi:hypothetical protein
VIAVDLTIAIVVFAVRLTIYAFAFPAWAALVAIGIRGS